jgi:hypothetical protein
MEKILHLAHNRRVQRNLHALVYLFTGFHVIYLAISLLIKLFLRPSSETALGFPLRLGQKGMPSSLADLATYSLLSGDCRHMFSPCIEMRFEYAE